MQFCQATLLSDPDVFYEKQSKKNISRIATRAWLLAKLR